MGRYHLPDPFMRLFFRFIGAQQGEKVYKPEQALAGIERQIPALVGRTAFEERAHEWVAWAGDRGQLPFAPQVVRPHWPQSVEVDLVAVNREKRSILLGSANGSSSRWRGLSPGI